MTTLTGILAGICGFITAYPFINKEKAKSNWWFAMLLIGLIGVVIFSFWGGRLTEKDSPSDIKSSKFRIKTEIRQEFLNGKEISRDTIYKFIPK